MSAFASVEPQFIVLPALGGLFLLAVVAIVRDRRKRFQSALHRVAARVEGTLIDGGWFAEPRLTFRVSGRDATLELHRSWSNSPSYSRVLVDVRGHSPGFLHVVEEDFGQTLLKLLGGEDLEIGDPAFDKDYVVKATPSALARRTFSRERRAEGIGIVRRLQGYLDSTFALGAQSLTVSVRQCLRDESDLLTLIETAASYVAFVIPPAALAGIDLEEVTHSTEGACPVCGAGLVASVRCESCRTPHHAECWQYLGRCSTYACRGKRAVA